jgi:hypothetical protein
MRTCRKNSLPTATVVPRLGDDLDVAAITDTRQRLASKPIRPYLLEILKCDKLARSVPSAQQGQVAFGDPMSIVRDLDKLQPAFFNGQFDRGRPGVERVFDELFDSIGRAVNNLFMNQLGRA